MRDFAAGQASDFSNGLKDGWKEGMRDRRLAGRVLACWQKHSGDRLPAWRDIKEADFGEDWPFCFAVDLSLSVSFPYYIYMGDAVSRLADPLIPASGGWFPAPLDIVIEKLEEAALSREPVSYRDTVTFPGGKKGHFRGVLLPLADNGVDVSHIFGAINGKRA